MAKPLDARKVEFAYLGNISVELFQDGLHQITLAYDLKDADGRLIVRKSISHELEASPKQPATDILNKLTSTLLTWVKEDKDLLSGFNY